ncbi:hypothetical protein EGW08_009627 [Elysia chlorotica]|uniref:Uncharacterized protein n=1 Tax=Elysia chlorotica TaxID=188477 RepID=A0A3S0ZTS3_ELYCH|nr:hypothetical protein EGW08_009627 [Elysia chlorotica]
MPALGIQSNTRIVVLLFCLFGSGNAACSFPSTLTGTWLMSEPSIPTKTFTSTQVSPFSLTYASNNYNNLIFECHINSGNFYVMKTATPIQILTVNFEVYFCWSLSSQTINKFLYYASTDEDSAAGGARVKIIPTSTSVTDYNTICDTTSFSNGDFRVMIKQGTASSERITCPDSMLATGTYTMTDSSGTDYCTGGASSLDGCSATGTLTANYTACSTKIFSSAGGTAYCMYQEDFSSTDPTTNTAYISMFNTDSSVDSSSTHFFTCVVVYSIPGNSSISMSTYPNYCFNTTYQNATYMSQSGGYTIDWTASTTCQDVTTISSNTDGGDTTVSNSTDGAATTVSTSTDVSSSSTISTGIIIAIVIACVLFILIVILVIFVIYKFVYLKNQNRPSSRIVPDTLPNTAMSQADKNKRMMFTPAPPKSAGPGGREGDYYDGGRPGSELSLHPTVSQLANYRTPTPFISDSKVAEGEIIAEMRSGTTPYPENQQTRPNSQTQLPGAWPEVPNGAAGKYTTNGKLSSPSDAP